MKVFVLNFRWRSGMEDTDVYKNISDVNAAVIAAANENRDDSEGPFADVDAAIESLNNSDHCVYIEECEIIE